MPCWYPTLNHASNMRLFLVTRPARHWLSNRGHWGWLWIEVQSPNYSFIDLLGIICKFKAGNALHESIHMNLSADNHDPWSLKIFLGPNVSIPTPSLSKSIQTGIFWNTGITHLVLRNQTDWSQSHISNFSYWTQEYNGQMWIKVITNSSPKLCKH